MENKEEKKVLEVLIKELEKEEKPKADIFSSLMQMMIIPMVLPLLQQTMAQTLSTSTVNVNVQSSVADIPITITSSTTIIGVDIKASTVTLNVNIESISSEVVFNVNITGSVTLNVNIGSISSGVVFDVNITGSIQLNVNVTNSVLNTNINVFPFEKWAEDILENPGFETGDKRGWNSGGTGSWVVQSTVKYGGSYAAQLNPDANCFFQIFTIKSYPCHPGQVVEFSCAMKADANITKSHIIFCWYTIEGKFVSSTSSPNFLGNYDWTLRTFRAIVPSGVATFLPLIVFYSGSVAGVGYVDSCHMVRRLEPALDTNLNIGVSINAQTISTLKIEISAQTIEAVTILAPSAKAINIAQNIVVSSATGTVGLAPNSETTLFSATGRGRIKTIGFTMYNTGGNPVDMNELRIYIDGSLKFSLNVWGIDALCGGYALLNVVKNFPDGFYEMPVLSSQGGLVRFRKSGGFLYDVNIVLNLEAEYTTSFSVRIYEYFGNTNSYVRASITFGGYA